MHSCWTAHIYVLFFFLFFWLLCFYHIYRPLIIRDILTKKEYVYLLLVWNSQTEIQFKTQQGIWVLLPRKKEQSVVSENTEHSFHWSSVVLKNHSETAVTTAIHSKTTSPRNYVCILPNCGHNYVAVAVRIMFRRSVSLSESKEACRYAGIQGSHPRLWF